MIQGPRAIILRIIEGHTSKILQHALSSDEVCPFAALSFVHAYIAQCLFLPIREIRPVVSFEPNLLAEQLLHHALLALLPCGDLSLLRGDDVINSRKQVGNLALLGREGTENE